MLDLELLSYDELIARLNNTTENLTRLNGEVIRRQEIARSGRRQHIKDNVELLLTLLPNHSRTSCSDEDRQEVIHRCTRCFLLEIRDYDYWPDEDFDVEIDFCIRRTV